MKTIGVHFSQEPNKEIARYFDINSACMRLGEVLQDKCCLLILDNVWEIEHVKSFQNVLGTKSRLLITTRDSKIAGILGIKELKVELLSVEEGVKLLSIYTEKSETTYPQIVKELSGLPLAIMLVGKNLHDTGKSGIKWLEKFDSVSQIKYGRKSKNANESVKVSIDMSVNAIFEADESEKILYYSLGIFPENVWIPEDVIVRLWLQIRKDLTEDDCCDIINDLKSLALIERNVKNCVVKIHDLLHSYNRENLGDYYIGTQNQLITAFNPENKAWPEVSLNEFLYTHFAYHLKEAGRVDELRNLLFDFAWLQAKLYATNITALIADYDVAMTRDEQNDRQCGFSLLKNALQLSAHVLVEQKNQLWEQLYGRLYFLPNQHPEVQALLEMPVNKICLRPLKPCLIPPGTSMLRTLQGHESLILSVAMNHEIAISASDDHTLRIWNWKDGDLMRVLRGHQYGVTSVAISSDGKQAISGSYDHTLKIWDVKTESALMTLQSGQGSVFSVALSADNRLAVSGGQNGTLKVWDFATGCELKTLYGHQGAVATVFLSADGKKIVSGSYDRTIKIWDIESGQEIRTLRTHTGAVLAVALYWGEDKKIIVSGSADCSLKVWYFDTEQEIQTLHKSHDWISSIKISSDGRFIVFGSYDNNLRIWDFDTSQTLREFPGHGREVTSVSLSPNDLAVVSGSHDRTVKVWDLKIDQQQSEFLYGERSIMSIATTEDGKIAFCGSADGTLHIYDTETQTLVQELERQKWIVRSVAISRDGKIGIAGLGGDYTLKVWDLETGKELRKFKGHNNRVRTVALSPDNKFAVSGSDDRTIKAWNIVTGKEFFTLNGFSHKGAIGTICLSPDGKTLYSGSDDTTIRSWDIETCQKLSTFYGHTKQIYTLALSSDGKTLFSGSGDAVIRAWDSKTGKELFTLRGHTSWVWSVIVSKDNKLLASTSEDSSLRIWDLKSRQNIATFYFEHPIFTCAFALDNVIIVGGAAYRTPHFLKLESYSDSHRSC